MGDNDGSKFFPEIAQDILHSGSRRPLDDLTERVGKISASASDVEKRYGTQLGTYNNPADTNKDGKLDNGEVKQFLIKQAETVVKDTQEDLRALNVPHSQLCSDPSKYLDELTGYGYDYDKKGKVPRFSDGTGTSTERKLRSAEFADIGDIRAATAEMVIRHECLNAGEVLAYEKPSAPLGGKGSAKSAERKT